MDKLKNKGENKVVQIEDVKRWEICSNHQLLFCEKEIGQLGRVFLQF